jgi:hypothetical protein
MRGHRCIASCPDRWKKYFSSCSGVWLGRFISFFNLGCAALRCAAAASLLRYGRIPRLHEWIALHAISSKPLPGLEPLAFTSELPSLAAVSDCSALSALGINENERILLGLRDAMPAKEGRVLGESTRRPKPGSVAAA